MVTADHLSLVPNVSKDIKTHYLPNARRIPVVGKHSRRITCGSWSTSNLLALGGEDKILTISNSEGDTLRTAPLRGDPSDVQFSEMKTDERSMGENTVSRYLPPPPP